MTTDSTSPGVAGDEKPDQQGKASPVREAWRPAPPAAVPPVRPAPVEGSRGTGSSYPVATQLQLDDPARRLLGKRRDRSQIPKIKAHEVLVWRVGDKYIVDSRQLRDSDDVVVDASSVSVVSVRPGTEVAVSFTIDSRDASMFTVKVTFVCSVTHPDVVVRDGQVNVADTLLAYLRGYQDLFSIGLKYPITAINDARAEMTAQVKAYMTLRPPKIPGIQIGTSPTVQVKTPAQIASYENDARLHWIEMQREAAAAELEMMRQGLMLDKAARFNDAVAGNSGNALGIAMASGDMNAADHAERRLQVDAEQQQREQADRLARDARQFAVEDRNADWDRDERKDQVTWERETLRERIAWERAQLEKKYADEQESIRRAYALEDQKALWAHEEEKDKIGWERAQLESQRADKQESIRRLMEAEEKYLEALAQAGHFDTHVEDIGEEMQRIRRIAAAGLDGPEDRSALAGGAGRQAAPAGPDDGHGN